MSAFLPQKFDANEWFLTISLISMLLIVILLPKRFPTIITLTMFSIGVGVAAVGDLLFGAQPADLFDANDRAAFELYDIVNYFQYPFYSYIYVYLYEKLHIHKLFTVLFVVAWSGIGVLAEVIAIHFQVFHYEKGWNYGYSFIFYLIVQSSLVLLFNYLKRKYKQLKRDDGYEWG